MPTYRKLTREEVQALTSVKSNVDLTPYVEFVRPLLARDWGAIDLDEQDVTRTVKRRLFRAATLLAKPVRWRRADQRTVRFEVLS